MVTESNTDTKDTKINQTVAENIRNVLHNCPGEFSVV